MCIFTDVIMIPPTSSHRRHRRHRRAAGPVSPLRAAWSWSARAKSVPRRAPTSSWSPDTTYGTDASKKQDTNCTHVAMYIYIYYIHTCAVYCIACSTIPMKIREFFFRTGFFDASGGLVQDKLAIQGCGWNWGYVPGLVMTNSLLLKMVIYSGFTHWKWWFSIVMWLFTRRYCLVPKMNGLNGESLSQMPLKNKVPGWIWNGWCGKHQEEVERQSWRIS